MNGGYKKHPFLIKKYGNVSMVVYQYWLIFGQFFLFIFFQMQTIPTWLITFFNVVIII